MSTISKIQNVFSDIITRRTDITSKKFIQNSIIKSGNTFDASDITRFKKIIAIKKDRFITNTEYKWDYLQQVNDICGNNGDRFGWDTTMNNKFVFIGSYRSDINTTTSNGSVHIYERINNNLIETQIIRHIIPITNQNFGISVDVNNFHNNLFVGAIGDISGGINVGSVSIYDFDNINNVWVFNSIIYDPSGNDGINGSFDFGI